VTQLLTVAQTADQLALSQLTVRRMLLDGRLKGTRIGASVRIPSTEVENLIRKSTSLWTDPMIPLAEIQANRKKTKA
jgi:excisionase family DNA binding protein